MNNMKEHFIKTPKTARYYIAGEPSRNTKNLWFVIHGFGQLAGEFIKQFDYLVNDETIVIAPEGLSRSYFGDKTGASWMTKEDREHEIEDYVRYLDNLFDEIYSAAGLDKLNVNILGFSQGVHTAARWFTRGKHNFQKLVLCSSDFPRDADFEKLRDKLENANMYYFWGDNDEFISKAAFEKSVELLVDKQIAFENYPFKGKHIILHEQIKKLACDK